jgi:hypothetical protein
VSWLHTGSIKYLVDRVLLTVAKSISSILAQSRKSAGARSPDLTVYSLLSLTVRSLPYAHCLTQRLPGRSSTTGLHLLTHYIKISRYARQRKSFLYRNFLLILKTRIFFGLHTEIYHWFSLAYWPASRNGCFSKRIALNGAALVLGL